LIIEEDVLHRPVGGEQVKRAQLKRLLVDAQRPNITIQVLPFSVGTHPAVNGPFEVLTFPDLDDADLVYVESHLGEIYLEKERDVEVYERMFDDLAGMALTPEQSMALAATFMQDHRE
jgi:hypothetical protein